LKKNILFFILIISTLFLFNACENQAAVINAPIKIKNLPKGLVIAEINPKQIEITVTGYKSALNNLPLFKILYEIDLSDAKEGEVLLQTTEDAIELPPNVFVKTMIPPEILIKLSKNNS